jgi:hypothetical protein
VTGVSCVLRRKHSLIGCVAGIGHFGDASRAASQRLLIQCVATMAGTHRSRKRHRQSSNHQDYLFWCYFHSFRILQCWADEASATSARRTQQSTSSSSGSSSSALSSGTASSESNSKISSAKGQLSYRSTCSRNWVRVTSLVLTCDSPGAYYYGSSTYRNSDTCAAGDKARISLSRELVTSSCAT